jgi:nucleotide-binding universal stress UspA family protein
MKRLAIFLDGSSNDRDSLASAVMLAARLDAHLDVYYPETPDSVFGTLADGSAAIVTDPTLDHGLQNAHAAFEQVCADMDTARWLQVPGNLDDAIHDYGLLYDAIIVERLSEEQGPHAQAFNTALFELAAPVLVLPPAAPARIGDSIAVVWTGTVQSVRALRSSLPLLARAAAVHLLTNTANTLARPEEALAYLAVQGVQATPVAFDGAQLTARGRGRAVIEAVRAAGADLMVIGAFGERRIDALFGLGRTTRKLVTAAPVPLLLQS